MSLHHSNRSQFKGAYPSHRGRDDACRASVPSSVPTRYSRYHSVIVLILWRCRNHTTMRPSPSSSTGAPASLCGPRRQAWRRATRQRSRQQPRHPPTPHPADHERARMRATTPRKGARPHAPGYAKVAMSRLGRDASVSPSPSIVTSNDPSKTMPFAARAAAAGPGWRQPSSPPKPCCSDSCACGPGRCELVPLIRDELWKSKQV